MCKAILELHESFGRNSHYVESLHAIALHGAVVGVLMWQAYARSIEQ
jgi:hypothetical protein